MRVGIPRALLYYQYYPMWRTFFEGLGAEVFVSSPTTKLMLASGCSRLIAETCLPVKVFCGHVLSLANGCDCVFIPSIHSVEQKVYSCPKFIGLPDMMRATVPECPPILDPDVDVNTGKRDFYQAIYKLGRPFTRSPLKVRKAAETAWQVHQTFQRRMLSGLTPPEAIEGMFPQSVEEPEGNGSHPIFTIGLIGHPYLLYDEYVSHRLVPQLREMGVKVLSPEMVERARLRASICELVERPYWACEDEVIGAGAYYLGRGEVDGVVSVVAFGCGPDSLMIEVLQRYAKRLGKPFMQLTLDEHTAETGLMTRLEAFLDMVRRGKRPQGISPPASWSQRGGSKRGSASWVYLA